MRENGSASSGFDTDVREIVRGLEQQKARIVEMGDAARRQHDRVSRAIALHEQEKWAITAELESLHQEAQSARRKLEELTGGTPSFIELSAAVDYFADRTTAVRVAEAKVAALSEQMQFYQQWAGELAPLVHEGTGLAEEVANAIQFVQAHFRELGSRLETAKQTRALGLNAIRAQEEERRRLAREIHDGPTQLLNSVVLRIDVCQRFFDSDLPRLKEELQQLKELVRLSLQDVRKIIFDLRPMTLDDLGVIPALRGFLKDFQAKTGIETDIAVFGTERRYDQAFEIATFRIVQEALTNAYKHADATRVWVKVETAGGKDVKVVVKDDGVGFDPSQVRAGVAGSKFGLVAMRERAELIGGSMEIQSAPGQGTKLQFVFPLPD